MRGGFVRGGLCVAALIWAGTVPAAVVHVITQQSLDGGEPAVLADVTQETGGDYRTAAAPAVAGYVFTHWTSSDANGFTPRDVFGRAYEQAKYHLYQKLTLTANYLPVSRDTDRDGVADGWEIYWYGNLTKNAASDTDGDGYTFAQELAAGTNPLMNDRAVVGGVVKLDSEEWLYNPKDYPLVTIRSEPEGVLCPTTIEVVAPGTVKTTPDLLSTGKFAYWKLNGVRQADAFGRARDMVSFTMTRENVVLTAVAAEDEETRQKLYWYGTTSVSLTSDTDGDGFTFAEELAAGTSPVMPNRTLTAGVTWRDSDEWLYNPKRYSTYVIRSEPEGALFETQTDTVAPGTAVVTPSVSKAAGFAYWTLNGVRQADPFGRALDTVRLTAAGETIELIAWTESDAEAREQLYWYGRMMDLSSDTDGDGYTFAEEIAAGTNPLLPDRAINGGVVWRDAEDAEMNLQPYEKVGGAVMEGNYVEWTSWGMDVTPVVADVNGDGRWDLIVLTMAATNVFLNVGSSGNPEFVRERDISIASTVDLQMNSIAKLSAFALDVPAPSDALSATTNGAALLVSDADGRIWYYARGDGDVAPYQLQHKVWGGSYAGFAKGLKLAAVDWEDDGDLDCLCGTADGKLMLLRNPKVGRPTNVRAQAGVDNVLLTWDPNAQSRIRGYKVYRDAARIAEPVLPTYRDTGLAPGGYAYEISSVSRFYTAGNSTPIVDESPRTAAVRTEVGGVTYFWNDVNATLGARVEVLLSVENAYHYDVAGRTVTVTFDPAFLTPVKVVKTGLTEGVDFTESAAGGTWTVTFKSGTLPAGGGKVLGFLFDTLQVGTTKVGDATVTVAPRTGATEVPPFSLGDVNGDGKIDLQDLRDLAKFKEGTGRKYNVNNLKAGDFNGNGKLDNADYQALRELLKQMGLLFAQSAN